MAHCLRPTGAGVNRTLAMRAPDAHTLRRRDGGGVRMLDVLIQSAKLCDGTGNPWYRADVAVKGGRIVAIGRIAAKARRVIDGFASMDQYSRSRPSIVPLRPCRP